MPPNDENIWNGSYKIPWDDADFSRRMLREHVSQEHDLASRREEWIDRQVSWIHRDLLREQSSRILDLGCGPGFYSQRLVQLGHHCMGIDFGPASIEYAKQNNPDTSRCEFLLGDLRHVAFGGPYDLAMVLYGELNVFAPDEAAVLLRKTRESLVQGGTLIIEVQTPDAIEQLGRTEVTEYSCDTGLFSDNPHHCRTENKWLPDERVSIQLFSVTELDSENTQIFQSTTKAWSDDELQNLLLSAGFRAAAPCPQWPGNTSSLVLWSARSIAI